MVSGKNATGKNVTGRNRASNNGTTRKVEKSGTFLILGFGSLGKFNISVHFLPTLPFVPLLPVPFLPVPFSPEILKNIEYSR